MSTFKSVHETLLPESQKHTNNLLYQSDVGDLDSENLIKQKCTKFEGSFINLFCNRNIFPKVKNKKTKNTIIFTRICNEKQFNIF